MESEVEEREEKRTSENVEKRVPVKLDRFHWLCVRDGGKLGEIITVMIMVEKFFVCSIIVEINNI